MVLVKLEDVAGLMDVNTLDAEGIGADFRLGSAEGIGANLRPGSLLVRRGSLDA
jgi:hypothetical protein